MANYTEEQWYARYDGEIMETLFAPMDSKVFFMHTDPLTYANTAVFKLI